MLHLNEAEYIYLKKVLQKLQKRSLIDKLISGLLKKIFDTFKAYLCKLILFFWVRKF